MDSEGAVDPVRYEEPFEEFERWYAEARQSEPKDANAMTLATATADDRRGGRPGHQLQPV